MVTKVSGSTRFSNGLIVEFQLAGDRYHNAIQFLFRQRPKRSDTQLAAQHDIKRMRFGTAGFVAELQPFDKPFFSGRFFISPLHQFGKDLVKIDL